jgi:hypothetical protein
MRIAARGTGRDEPRVPVGGVVGDEVHQHPQAALVRAGDERVEGCQIPEERVNVGVVGDVRRVEEGLQVVPVERGRRPGP